MLKLKNTAYPVTAVLSWFDKATVQHLRLPFSFFLMPVFLFALSQSERINWTSTCISFIIFHLLIFPSSNGYNSHQDRDETSIGGLKYPPKVTSNLFYATALLDVLGILSGLLISGLFAVLIMIFVIMSRAYSYRKLRLKKYPFIGFLTVFVFQGAYIYMASAYAIQAGTYEFSDFNNLLCGMAASLFIGSMYPLTQIYQHETDKKDGVITLSYKLGYNGTFIFSATLFISASALLYYNFMRNDRMIIFLIYSLIALPLIIKMTSWFCLVRKDPANANFEHTMAMNLLSSSCMNVFFLLLFINNYFNWF